MSLRNTASDLNDRYLTIKDVRAAGGTWSRKEKCFVFADGSTGYFSEDKSRGSKNNKDGNWTLHFISGDQSINWSRCYPDDNYKSRKEKKSMKKGRIIVKKGARTPNGYEKRLEVHCGRQGKGGLVGAVTYWPWSPVSVATAFETAEDIAWRAGIKLED